MEVTKNIGLICEFNPLHNGHRYLIETIKKLNHPCRIICVMSGNYTQRGDVAIADKFTRAKWAIENGADAVFELILPYNIMSAEGFARGAVAILDSLGAVDELWFGSESADVDVLIDVAKIIDSKEFSGLFHNNIKNNNAYNYATIVSDTLSNGFGYSLKGANDLLGIEYIRALNLYKSRIKPQTIKRVGAMHDAVDCENLYPSASFLRKTIGSEEYSKMKGLTSCNIIEYFRNNQSVFFENNERAVIEVLRRRAYTDNSHFLHCKELGNKICKAAISSKKSDEICSLVKTKNFTMSRIRRAILSLYLGIEQECSNLKPDFTNVLALNKQGIEFLAQTKKIRTINVITKPSMLKSMQGELYNLNIAGDFL